MATAPPVTELELIERARTGDRAAFQQLYESYLPKVFDFTLGMLRNRADAEDATSETFLRVVEGLSNLREAAAFKGWVYKIARNAALRIVDARKRTTPVADHAEAAQALSTSGFATPESGAEVTDLRALVEEATATLSERDRSVFELTARHGLSSTEVGRALGVTPVYAYVLVNRLKSSVEEAIEAVALARIGRSDCPVLARLLERFAGEVSPRMRKAVSRHARTCDTCTDTKRRRAALPALMQGIAFAEPGADFARRLSERIDASWGSTPWTPSADGRAGRLAGATAAVIVLVTALTGLAAQRTIVPAEQSVRPTREVLEVREQPEEPAVEKQTSVTTEAPRERRPSIDEDPDDDDGVTGGENTPGDTSTETRSPRSTPRSGSGVPGGP